MVYSIFKQAKVSDALLSDSVLETLKYFHMFRHPLYEAEILKFLRCRANACELQQVLKEMVMQGTVYYSHNMYALENTATIFLKRLAGSDYATYKMKEAERSARIIAMFPFVRCVCVSGSLSKGYADENSDIDFFIITAQNRLWICRTLLHLFKKATFLFNKQHSFCMNYFIDESRACLEEQNIFTATEIATLAPMYNKETFVHFLNQNHSWVLQQLPNVTLGVGTRAEKPKKSIIKKTTEWLLNRMMPATLNRALMNLTDRLWQYKWQKKNYPPEDYTLAMKTKWYVSKQHPLNYQKKVLEFNKPAIG